MAEAARVVAAADPVLHVAERPRVGRIHRVILHQGVVGGQHRFEADFPAVAGVRNHGFYRGSGGHHRLSVTAGLSRIIALA
jgi:hypothetical protein